MPSTVYVPNWLRIVLYVAHEGSVMQLPMDYQFSAASPPSSAQILECLTNLWAVLGPLWAAQNANTYTATALVGTDMSAAGKATATYTPTTNTVGTKAGDALPSNCAGVATWRSGLTGRSYRGRTYGFGWQEQDAVGSYWTNGALTTYVNMIAQIKNFTNGSGVIPVAKCIVSRKLLHLQPVQAAYVDNTVDSQRRRLPGRGS